MRRDPKHPATRLRQAIKQINLVLEDLEADPVIDDRRLRELNSELERMHKALDRFESPASDSSGQLSSD